MSLDEQSENTAKNDELPNLPERPIADAGQVKGGSGATTAPTRQQPVVSLPPGVLKPIDPCW
jgi:hypothetical protein